MDLVTSPPEYLLTLIIPIIMGFSMGYICKVQNSSGNTVNFRPPSWAFGVAWTILYILIGISWFLALKKDYSWDDSIVSLFYIWLNIILCSWVYLYSCKDEKIYAIYSLILSIVAALFCYTLGNVVSKMLIVPLIGWLLFATLINVAEVQKI